MQAREPRRKVFIKARMRLDASWKDVCIRNISSGGLMISAPDSIDRGSYVEIRRGRHVIVGRIVWTQGQQCGLQTQDRLPIDAIIAEPDRSEIDFKKAVRAQPSFERRAAPRDAGAKRDPERARHLARAVEFASVASAGAFLAIILAVALVQAVAAPLSQVGAALVQPEGSR